MKRVPDSCTGLKSGEIAGLALRAWEQGTQANGGEGKIQREARAHLYGTQSQILQAFQDPPDSSFPQLSRAASPVRGPLSLPIAAMAPTNWEAAVLIPQQIKTMNAQTINTASPTATDLAVPGPDEIACRAYEIWQREGCPAGRDQEHWLRAEAELRAASPAPTIAQDATERPGLAGKKGGARAASISAGEIQAVQAAGARRVPDPFAKTRRKVMAPHGQSVGAVAVPPHGP